MTLTQASQTVPLSVSKDGTIFVSGTRVSLDSLVQNYDDGATAEEIVLRFPALQLADVHACLAYYLNNREQIRRYLSARELQADSLRERIASDPRQSESLARMRDRINSRNAARFPHST